MGVLVEQGNMLGVDYEWRGVQSSFEATVKEIDREYEKTHESSDVAVFKGKGIGVVVVGPDWASLKGDFPAAILYLQGADDAVQNALQMYSGNKVEVTSRRPPTKTEAATEGTPDPRSTGATTPKEVFVQMSQAMFIMDKDKLVGCFTGKTEELDAIASLADYGAAAIRFKNKLIEVYGEKEWQNFQDPAKAPEDGDTSFILVTESALKMVDDLKIRIEGNIAYFKSPGESKELLAVQIKDKWFMWAPSFLSPGMEPKAFGDLMNRLAAIVSKYERAIGYKELTREDIDAELGRAMLKAMSGISTFAKHRFDIDKIK